MRLITINNRLQRIIVKLDLVHYVKYLVLGFHFLCYGQFDPVTVVETIFNFCIIIIVNGVENKQHFLPTDKF